MLLRWIIKTSLSSRESFYQYGRDGKHAGCFNPGRSLRRLLKTAENYLIAKFPQRKLSKCLSKSFICRFLVQLSLTIFNVFFKSVFPSAVFNLQQWFLLPHCLPSPLFFAFFPSIVIYLISFYFVSASSAIKNEFICSIVMYKRSRKHGKKKVRKSFLPDLSLI